MAEPSTQSAADDPLGGADDSLLVGRVLRGDRAAYGELVGRHMRRAFSIAYRVLEHREDAQDVVQDAFLRALERIDTFDPARAFGPWFYRIVMNAALNLRRSRAVRATAALPEQLPAATPGPLRETEQALTRERVRSALATLSERQRTVVQLADLEGMSSTEIAAILDVSAVTVRWHLHEARRRLRKVLEPLREGS